MDRTDQQIQDDHDLLVEIKTELRLMRESFDNQHKTMAKEIGSLKEGKAGVGVVAELKAKIETKAEVHITDDHETRLRRLESWGLMAIGALALMEIAFKFFL